MQSSRRELKGLKGWARKAVSGSPTRGLCALGRKAAAFAMLVGFAAAIQLTTPAAFAQTSVTGSINGVVMDSTGAVVPNAAVTVKDTETGATLNLTSNADGRFTAPFLKPDTYDVSATAPGLQSTTTSIPVLVGQQSSANLTVTPSANTQTVQVSANNAQLIDTQTANTTTTFTTAQFQNLPMPGGDITTIAFTVPGVNAGAGSYGYGSFTSDGLPSISNLVIINGADDNDPFLDINNSGSSNLTLGQQEIAQAAVVQNGYSVQYGRQAGVILTYVTKSGANRLHGLLQYNYNSDGLNANGFFNNLSGTPKSKAISTQYAANIGGPIKRDKLFFFVNTEGLRYVLPAGGFVNFPTPQLQASILANPALAPSAASAYSTLFSGLTASPAYATAPLIGSAYNYGCGSLNGTPDHATGGTLGSSPSEGCISQTFVNNKNLNTEWLATGRLDWDISEKHKIFFRVTDDQGKQASFTSLINPLWNAASTQPTYGGQMNDTYSVTPNVVNQLIASSFYYAAVFSPPNIPASLAASPTSITDGIDGGNNNLSGIGQFFTGCGFATSLLGAPWCQFPQGRNVTQYQIVDDVSWLKGNHSFKFGGNFKRDDVTDTILSQNATGGYNNFGSVAEFASGSLATAGSSFNQNFTNLRNIYAALYNLGIYAQDEWRVKPNLVIDYGIRFDRNGNPACRNNCFTHYVGGFPDTTATLDTPYNATLSAGHSSAFPSIEPVLVQPRAGFNWDTRGDGKTVVRGGVGLFADTLPGVVVEEEYQNFPNLFASAISSGNVGTGPGTAYETAASSANAVLTGFSQGATFNSLTAELAPSGVTFAAPNYATTPKEYHGARYLEYSMQLQRQIGPADAVILSYAGNHGYDLTIGNNHPNQFVDPALAGAGYGFPAAQPDSRFNEVSTFTNNAISNYNGFSVEYKHIDQHGFTADVSYTWSHALDDISNGGSGGVTPYNGAAIGTQISPNSVSQLMYSNSDYDYRNSFVADVTYVEPNLFSNKIESAVAGGWTLGGKGYWRSGQPFSVVNSNVSNAIFNGTGGTTALADVVNKNFNHTCNSYSSPCFQTPGIFNGAAYAANPANTPTVTLPLVVVGTGPAPQTDLGNVPRNAFYGPHYFDLDVTAYKDLFKKGSVAFQVGAQAYNVLNHVNFASPGATGNNDASNPASLGFISDTVSPVTSPYGSGQGGVVSGRVLVVQGRLLF